ncbi:MAG TPA: site-specific integrase [Stellaceae bacterium]|nr:site-specific integrase [Stellaceae bacterium]
MATTTTPLRQRMIGDMKVRNMSPLTQGAYVRSVKNFSAFFGRSPDTLTFEDVRTYRLRLISLGKKPQTINQIVCALRFFYAVTLRKPEAKTELPLARRADILPAVLSPEEVARFLSVISNVKHRAAFATIYAAGLRVSEVAALKVGDIDSQRMVIHIRQGKGSKDRFVMLSELLLGILRTYWRAERPKEWLFPGSNHERPITTRALQLACHTAAEAAELDKKVTVHTLRHCFATHLLERGVDIRVIQDLLGHRHITATSRYARVAINTIRQIQSPLEHLTFAASPPP